jgi:hypothetical protein
VEQIDLHAADIDRLAAARLDFLDRGDGLLLGLVKMADTKIVDGPWPASHIAGGLRGPADSGGATFAAAALRESVLGSDARIRGSTAFAAAVWAGSGAAAWTVPAIPRTGSSVSHKARRAIMHPVCARNQSPDQPFKDHG